MASKSGGSENMTRLGMAVIDEFSQILRDVLANSISPVQLNSTVKSKNLRLRPEQQLLVQKAPNTGYIKFDVTLLYTLIRNLCQNVTQPTNGWGNEPRPGEETLGDDIERIRVLRNEIFAHIPSYLIKDADFQKYWSVITDVCKRAEQSTGGSYVDKLLEIENCVIDEQTEQKYIKMLEKMTESDQELKELYKDIKSKVERVEEKIEQLHIKGVGPSTQTKVHINTGDRQSDLGIYEEVVMKHFNAAVEEINESTKSNEFLELLESIAEVEKFSSFDTMQDKVLELVCKLSAKVDWYNTEVDEISGRKIRVRFLKVALQIKNSYNADIRFSRGSLILTLTFRTTEDLEKYNNDVKNGSVKRLLSDVILFPPLLSLFGLQQKDINVEVENVSEEISSDILPKSLKDRGTNKENKIHSASSCRLCKSPEPHFHCNTCRISVCSACVADHMSSQPGIQHNIISFKLKANDIKHLICDSHDNSSCEFHCLDCLVPVCSHCCTDSHQGHSVTDIADLYESKRRNICLDNHMLEVVMKKYDKIIKEMTQKISELSKHYNKLRILISTHGFIWHEEINKIISQYQSKINDMEKESQNILQESIVEMQDLKPRLRKIIEKNINTLNSNDGCQLLSYESLTEEMCRVPSIINITFPAFVADNPNRLNGQIGTLKSFIETYEEGHTIKKMFEESLLLIPDARDC